MPSPDRVLASVSVVVPALNAGTTLEACLSAVRAARPAGVVREVIVVDNGSTDRTVEAATRLGATVLRGPGLTVAALRNAGARAAGGAFLAFIDADCVVAPDWIANGLRTLADPKVAAAGSPTGVPTPPTWVESAWQLHRHRDNRPKLVDWLPTVALLVRAAAFREVGGFDESLATCEDVDLGYRLARTHRLASDPSMASTHLGEPKTLGQFFRKEIWRGRQSFAGILAHGVRRSELPSLLLPLYQAVAIAAFSWASMHGALTGAALPALIAAAILTGPSWMLAASTARQTGKPGSVGRLAVLYFAYASARAVAIVAGLLPTPRGRAADLARAGRARGPMSPGAPEGASR